MSWHGGARDGARGSTTPRPASRTWEGAQFRDRSRVGGLGALPTGEAGDDAAIEALLEYAPRYAAVAERAGVPFPSSFAPRVVGEVVGNATTDFGAPDVELPSDRPRRTAAATAHLQRQVACCARRGTCSTRSRPPRPRSCEAARRRSRHLRRRRPRDGGRAGVRAPGRRRHKPYDASDHAARDAMRVDLVEAILADRRESAWVERRRLRRTAWTSSTTCGRSRTAARDEGPHRIGAAPRRAEQVSRCRRRTTPPPRSASPRACWR